MRDTHVVHVGDAGAQLMGNVLGYLFFCEYKDMRSKLSAFNEQRR